MKYSSEILNELQLSPDKNKAEIYESKDLTIFKPNITLDSKAVFKNNYHLILTRSYVSKIKVDKKKFIPENNKLFIINPEQLIEGTEARNVNTYLAIFLKRNLLENISKQILNKSGINFKNCNYEINSDIYKLINNFIYEAINKQTGYEFVLECLSSQIVINILRCIELKGDELRDCKCISKKIIKRVIDYIQEYYNKDFSLIDLAAVANLSPYHFIRVFKSETGYTPFEYLTEIKIERAKELLKKEEYKVGQVGMECGFSSPSHFSSVFKKHTGVSPSTFRQAHRD